MTRPNGDVRSVPTVRVLLWGWKREAEVRQARGVALAGEMTPAEIDELIEVFEARLERADREEDVSARVFVDCDLAPSLGGKGRITRARAQDNVTRALLAVAGVLLLQPLLAPPGSWDTSLLLIAVVLVGILIGRAAWRSWLR